MAVNRFDRYREARRPTDELWRRRFAADPGIVGRPINLDGEQYEVIGVLPSKFHFPKLFAYQDRPIEIALVGDCHDAVLDRQSFQSVGRARFPLDLTDLSRDNIDQNGMRDPRVFQ